jgi:AraC-like DNA-binding protein
MLDFSEPAAFTRAFQRWSGVTPSVFRKNHRSRAQTKGLVHAPGAISHGTRSVRGSFGRAIQGPLQSG